MSVSVCVQLGVFHERSNRRLARVPCLSAPVLVGLEDIVLILWTTVSALQETDGDLVEDSTNTPMTTQPPAGWEH